MPRNQSSHAELVLRVYPLSNPVYPSILKHESSQTSIAHRDKPIEYASTIGAHQRVSAEGTRTFRAQARRYEILSRSRQTHTSLPKPHCEVLSSRRRRRPRPEGPRPQLYINTSHCPTDSVGACFGSFWLRSAGSIAFFLTYCALGRSVISGIWGKVVYCVSQNISKTGS